MNRFVKGTCTLAVALVAHSASSHAQTLAINGVGSSALFLELGQSATVAPTNAACIWSAKSGAVQANDATVSPAAVDGGQVWIEWTTGTGGSCTAPAGDSKVYSYLQTDSVVGDRSLFNKSTASGGSAGDPTAISNAGLITGTNATQVTNVPASVWNTINGAAFNAAGTDIRPEDAEFAITRALTSCGTAIPQYAGNTKGALTQYLGLGYTNNSKIVGYTGSTFNVVNFALPASFQVTPVGATPIVVAVSYAGDGANSGFNSTTGVRDIASTTLALYLDGTFGNTSDLITPGVTGVTNHNTNVFVREPLSGTYNTMEYAVPNNIELETSQDVGLNQIAFNSNGHYNQNCNGNGAPQWNAAGVHMGTLVNGAVRTRSIGTGQELSNLFASQDGLGYAFWGVSNFAGATSTSKYLTVDGVDPIQNAYQYGTIPTAAGNNLNNVTLNNVANGSYPIWSLLRLVTTSTAAQAQANNLANAAAQFVTTPGGANPDFIAYSNLQVEHAHFTPPAIYTYGNAPAPKNGVGGLNTEVGGDVAGVVISYQADQDYITDTGISNGFTGLIIGGHGQPTTSRRK